LVSAKASCSLTTRHLADLRHVVLIAGTPLDQAVVQYGPFVVNSKEAVYQALFDYQTFSNGFERAKDWKSEIGKSMVH
jgi:redox-sensitive bicupin YhaK (pirin superfamily)